MISKIHHCFFRFFIAAGFACLVASDAMAQQLPNLTPDQIAKLQQQYGIGGSSSAPTSVPSTVTQQQSVIPPVAPSSPILPASRLEKIMSDRAGIKLQQFGYDQLGAGRAVTVTQVGGVQDDYVLGPGDQIVVSLRGQENSEYQVTVDRDGRVVMPRLSPVSAGGRPFGEFKRDLIAAIQRTYVSTKGYVSIGQLRQINVLVSGEVNNSGVRTLTGLSTVVDAILVSDGIKKTGSLRNVHILRGGRQITIDLYSVLTGKSSSKSVTLADGDKIVVPPLGPAVAVAGWVRRPGIYEIAGGRSSMGVGELISIAGGLEVRGKYRLSLLNVSPDGRNRMETIPGASGIIHDSEVLFVQPAANQTVSKATLSGGMALAGQYVTKNAKLSDILKSPGALGDNPYTLFGVISRKDPVTLTRTLFAFTPVAVLKGTEDVNLQSDDIVRVISTNEAQLLFVTVTQYQDKRRTSDEALRNPETSAPAETSLISSSEAGSTTAVASAAKNDNNADRSELAALKTADTETAASNKGIVAPIRTSPGDSSNQSVSTGEIASNVEVTRLPDLATQLNVDPLVLINFLDDNAVNVYGAVHGPGLYLIGPKADIVSLLQSAGGVSRWADKSSIEVISTVVDSYKATSHTERKTVSLADNSATSFYISPRDQVRVNEVYTEGNVGSVTLQGQVRHVGSYQIIRGEHLSDLLIRAGGLTENAYPYGTVFLRRSAASLEQDAYRREAKDIENQLMSAMSRQSTQTKMSPDVFTALQGYVTQLKNQKALGRVTVFADPAVLAANPASDPLLEPNDVVYIPSRPYSVAMMGEVLKSGSVPYDPDISVEDYINRAGGYSQFADDSMVIVVLPDGSARRVGSSWFTFGKEDVPPGSTIYVGRDISGYDVRQMVVDIGSVFSQLAVTAASLAVMSNNLN